MSELYTVEVVVSGRVQGVGYRDFTRREAGKLGITGWVRNEPDGRVRAVLQHHRDEVIEELIVHLRAGPPSGRVTGLESGAVPGVGGFSGFEIRY